MRNNETAETAVEGAETFLRKTDMAWQREAESKSVIAEIREPRLQMHSGGESFRDDACEVRDEGPTDAPVDGVEGTGAA